MSINSGYTGSLNTIYAVGTYRSQWTGIDGAPMSKNIAIHSPLKNEAIGICLNLLNEILGPENQIFADANASYTVKVSQETNLAFGLKAGIKLLNIDFSKGDYQNPGDPLLNENIDNKLNPTLGAGAYYYSQKWYLGLSVPDFISDDFYDDNEMAVAKEEIQFYFIGGYVFDLSDAIKFKPTFLARYSENVPFSIDVSANVLFNERFSIGLSYRLDDAISALAGFHINESFFIGYSFDYSTNEFMNYNDGTHEIVLTYTLPQKDRRVNSPRYF